MVCPFVHNNDQRGRNRPMLGNIAGNCLVARFFGLGENEDEQTSFSHT